MSILMCVAEDNDFYQYFPVFDTNSGYRRTSWSRTSISIRYTPSGYTSTSKAFPGGAVTDCWLSCYAYYNPNSALVGRTLGIGKLSSGEKGVFWGYEVDSPYTHVTLFTYDGTTQVALAEETLVSTGAWVGKVDMQIIDYNGAYAQVKIYTNGAQDPVIDYTGSDINISGVTDLDCVMVVGHPAGAGTLNVSEIIVADEDTRSLGLMTMYPNAAGDANAWTNGYDTIDEVADVGSDVMYVNSGDADAQVNLYPTLTGSLGVRAAFISARALRTGDSTPDGLALGVKTGGSFDYGTKQTLTTGWNTYVRLMNTNPVTSNPWTKAELDALQLNLRSKT